MDNFLFQRSERSISGQAETHCHSVHDRFSTNLEELKPHLPNMIDLDSGLLDILLSRGILTYEQVEQIQDKPTHRGQVDQLVEAEIGSIETEKQKEEFLSVMDVARHKHVSNFIRGRGQHRQSAILAGGDEKN
jgi:hypothetical protein